MLYCIKGGKVEIISILRYVRVMFQTANKKKRQGRNPCLAGKKRKKSPNKNHCCHGSTTVVLRQPCERG